mmetsp:Transcript_65312/g.142287  ORF Transcript_65312/g.142287 Transcript_65312/m.142287 type:complete len:231 (-) Transcript_65312:1623-2315(-)
MGKRRTMVTAMATAEEEVEVAAAMAATVAGAPATGLEAEATGPMPTPTWPLQGPLQAPVPAQALVVPPLMAPPAALLALAGPAVPHLARGDMAATTAMPAGVIALEAEVASAVAAVLGAAQMTCATPRGTGRPTASFPCSAGWCPQAFAPGLTGIGTERRGHSSRQRTSARGSTLTSMTISLWRGRAAAEWRSPWSPLMTSTRSSACLRNSQKTSESAATRCQHLCRSTQ